MVRDACVEDHTIIDPGDTESVHVGFTTMAWSVHVLVHVYPEGTHAVPSHCSQTNVFIYDVLGVSTIPLPHRCNS